MKEVSYEEYLEKEKAFFDRYNEYIDKVVEVNSSDAYNEEDKEELLAMLKREYKGFTDVYQTDFFTELNDALIEKSNYSGIARHVADKVEESKGKHFLYNGKRCIINRVVTTIEDFYYELEDEDGNKYYYSTVAFPMECKD